MVKNKFRISVIGLFLVLIALSSIHINYYFLSEQNKLMANFDIITNNFSHINNESYNNYSIEAVKQQVSDIHSIKNSIILKVKYLTNYARVWIIITFIILCLLASMIIDNIKKHIVNLKNCALDIKNGNYYLTLEKGGPDEIKEIKSTLKQIANDLEPTQSKQSLASSNELWEDLSKSFGKELSFPVEKLNKQINSLCHAYNESPKDFPKHYLNNAEEMNHQLTRIINFEDNFKKFTTSSMVKKEFFDPSKIIYALTSCYKDKASFNIKITTNKKAFFDKSHFKNICKNLIINAIDANTRKRPICIAVYEEGNKLIVIVEDSGCGISRKNITRIFNPYYSSKGNGSGLGLALVKKLIIANGSDIYVQSNINMGTRIRFTIEASQQ